MTTQDLLNQFVHETQEDIAIVCEQYKDLDEPSWDMDTGKAAIWACGDTAFQEKMINREEGFVRVKVAGIHIYSCYAPPQCANRAVRSSVRPACARYCRKEADTDRRRL